ncbi:glycosyltransferase [Loktanella sp. IMCC34160]|uniref:glycosyltransferase family 2 protein n=1 Tax=Loktanella sp. IMCC34160 TaxID=2510646 RepID=UPI0013EA1C08|nr:glycosyltransferase [Loktanella sp. IMCC34160]
MKNYLRVRQTILNVQQKLAFGAQEVAADAALFAKISASKTTFSIVVPIYNTPEPYLRQCLQSVYDQIYQKWELVLVDDKSTAPHIRPALEAAANADPRVRVVFREENGNISKATNSGLEAATGDYYTVLDHDDLLHPAALFWMAEAIQRNPEAEYLYSDEDKTDKHGQHFYSPFLKPGWSPELLLQCMYTCHMSVFDRKKALQIGGYRSSFDGAQDYDFTLRFVSRFDRICHVDKILYHWREWEESTALNLDAKPEAYKRQRKALTEYLDAQGETYTIGDHAIRGHHKVTFLPRRREKVSIIIPTANKSAEINGHTENHANSVVRSILETTTYDNFEIILVHDNNLTDAQLRAFRSTIRVRLVEYCNDEGFNYSEKVNLGASAATGEHFLLMNDDTRVITPNWLERMLGMAQRPGVGAVGAKLLFPNGTVQHSGIWLRGNVAGHIDYGSERNALGYDLSGNSNRNCIGVTAACQLTPRAVFERLDGYRTYFPLNYNDVDYCLRVHQSGLRSVCLNDVELFHHEGASRSGGQEVATDEIERFLELWRERVPYDPYLPSNLV